MIRKVPVAYSRTVVIQPFMDSSRNGIRQRFSIRSATARARAASGTGDRESQIRVPDRFATADFSPRNSEPPRVKEPALRRKGYEPIFQFAHGQGLPDLTVPSRLTRCCVRSRFEQTSAETTNRHERTRIIATSFDPIRVHSWFFPCVPRLSEPAAKTTCLPLPRLTTSARFRSLTDPIVRDRVSFHSFQRRDSAAA